MLTKLKENIHRLMAGGRAHSCEVGDFGMPGLPAVPRGGQDAEVPGSRQEAHRCRCAGSWERSIEDHTLDDQMEALMGDFLILVHYRNGS